MTSNLETQTTSRKSLSTSTWIVRPRPLSAPRVRLLCFPHAGGNAAVFKDWPRWLPHDLEVCAVELPGHGRRLLEPPPVSIDQTLEVLLESLQLFRETPLALFGHSFGALMAFECARRLAEVNINIVHLFVSSHFAPQLRNPEAAIRHLPDAKFIEQVSERYSGIPNEITYDKEVVELWLPALRADFTMNETYQRIKGPLLECAISAFGGCQDRSVTPAELEAWRHQTAGDFQFRMFPGGHFFIDSAREAFLRAVTEDLETSLHGNSQQSHQL